MSISIEQIRHHQRILITGKRSNVILSVCKQVLDQYNRQYDWMTNESNSIEDHPMILILGEPALKFEPHIVIVDEVTSDTTSDYMRLADSMPKSGTLIYNSTNKQAKEICAQTRTDVHADPFSGTVNDAAKTLLKRLGILENQFEQAIKEGRV